MYVLKKEKADLRLFVPKDVKEKQKTSTGTENAEITKKVFGDRSRTNLLKSPERKLIMLLVQKMPGFVSPGLLTLTGGMGSLLVLAAFYLATYVHPNYLLLGIAGLALNWFGDSLDGRLAYYRNIPRKWFGFTLDVIMDWAGIVLIGLGYVVYAKDEAELLAFFFVALYGWSIIISQIRYKVTNQYAIDSGLVGPTELRVIIAFILVSEVQFHGIITYLATGITFTLFLINVKDSLTLLKLADLKDSEEKNKAEP